MLGFPSYGGGNMLSMTICQFYELNCWNVMGYVEVVVTYHAA